MRCTSFPQSALNPVVTPRLLSEGGAFCTETEEVDGLETALMEEESVAVESSSLSEVIAESSSRKEAF